MMPLESSRPPYVRFEMRGVENRAESISKGHYVEKEEPFALITQLGSRDTSEQAVDSWLANLEREVSSQRIPSAWLEGWRKMYAAWLKGEEAELNGTSLKMFPVIRPNQLKIASDMGVFTIEDLATLSSDAQARFGLGGTDLVRKAKLWLESSSNQGKTTERLAKLEVALAQSQARVVALEAEAKKSVKA